ncbi:MAG: tetratricopeptide repeat protein [Anaerolineaceae bacterium]|nr:tetratricopeptide repeat protein [Anaerolineaceae bacterium]
MTLRQILLAGLIIAFLGGCSGPPLLAPGLTPTPTATFAPTSTPTPTFVPTATQTPTPAPSAHVTNGDHAFWNGDYDQALQEYQSARDSTSDTEVIAASLLGIGRVQFQKGEYPAALGTIRGLLDQYATSQSAASAYFWLGQAYNAVRRYQDAADAYAQYLTLRPGIIDSYVQELRGDALSVDGNASAAIEAYEKALLTPHRGEDASLQLKIGQRYASTGNYAAAIDRYNLAYTTTTSDYTKADADLYSGQAYVAIEDMTNAGDRFRDAVTNFPKAYSAYASLVNMVDMGLPVSDYYRGVVDYYAGQYPAALAALDRFIAATPDHDGSALHYRALTQVGMKDYTGAITSWDELIHDYPSSSNWTDAWDEKAYILWADLDQFESAAQVLIDFVSKAPLNPQASAFLYEAGRIYERGDQLEPAAATWERLGAEYPGADQTFRGLLFAGVARYRLQQWNPALTDFQRGGLLASSTSDQAAAFLWSGKVYQKLGNDSESRTAWQQAALRDPTGYYSERAKELLSGRAPFSTTTNVDLSIDLNKEKSEAEAWLRKTFQLPPEIDLSILGSLEDDPRFKRGRELWSLGLYSEARDDFEDLRQSISRDAAASYRLVNYLSDLGVYRSAIMGARQILSLAGMDDAATLTAPAYFNHLRFGTYYRDLVLPAAQAENIEPLLAFALIRQESLFEGFAQSSADARGLMQIVPSTAKGVAANLNWPPNFTDSDLYRPMISIRLGMHYLNQQRNYFEGDLFAALAAYNGGPGNTIAWKSLAGNDPDLFLETVRIEETRTYIMKIYEIYTIYRALYFLQQ